MLDLLLFGQKTAPDFLWDARGGVLPPGATFARGSSGWFFNSAGVLTQAGNNVARFDNNPLTQQPIGYLAEMQSTNAIIWSADASHWSLTAVTTATDDTLGPDGTTLAQKITASAGTGIHYAGLGRSGTLAASSVIGQSVFVKQGSTRYAVIVDPTDTVYHLATFDFQTGAWATAGLNATTQTPRQLANGWWRLGLQSTNTNANAGGVYVAPSTTGTGTTADFSYTAAGTETVYVTGLQSESPAVGVTSYIPTGGNAVTRAADVLSLPLTSLSGWNANKGGVLVGTIRLHTLGPNATPTAVMIEDAGLNNLSGVEAAYGGGLQRGELWCGGASQARPQGVAARAPFVRTRIAFGWSPTRAQIANDGNLANTATGAFLLPVGPARMSVGNSGGASQLNGTVESIAYYAGARSDAFVQSVSQ